jgi:hypothetical protein
VKTINHPRKQSGQAIIKDVLKGIDELVNEYTHMQIEIIWILLHAEIEGNEHVDTEPKLAATNPTISQPHQYEALKSAQASSYITGAKRQWHKVWSESTKTAASLTTHHESKVRKDRPNTV